MVKKPLSEELNRVAGLGLVSFIEGLGEDEADVVLLEVGDVWVLGLQLIRL
jgi:hypothetical protein